MTDRTIDLDRHRGIAAQKATFAAGSDPAWTAPGAVSKIPV